MEPSENPGMDQDLVILLGDAVFIQSMEACLHGTEDFGLIGLYSSVIDAPQRLKSLQPDLVVMDVSDDRSHLAVSLLRELPGAAILGVDQARQEALVTYGPTHPTPTIEHLIRIIRHQAHRGSADPLGIDGEWYTNQNLDSLLTDLDLTERNQNEDTSFILDPGVDHAHE